ncbi:hypothetical protein ACFS6H_11365 [Terrimonas rubra]|uniref:Uncharacterized protein n=1 Tax=Terrimonas rubra TaxID=1035890 RepID=A0ABW6A822_9BACT
MLSSAISPRQRTSRILFLLITGATLFAFLCKSVDVYSFAPMGAIFELLWLPTLAALFIVPFIALKFWFDERFKLLSFNLFTILIAATAILFVIFK